MIGTTKDDRDNDALEGFQSFTNVKLWLKCISKFKV